ncbi:hypothetical protein ACSBR1_016126 [Camellia fascicularis]
MTQSKRTNLGREERGQRIGHTQYNSHLHLSSPRDRMARRALPCGIPTVDHHLSPCTCHRLIQKSGDLDCWWFKPKQRSGERKKSDLVEEWLRRGGGGFCCEKRR